MDFNPRSLAGATVIDCKRLEAKEFQSTLPCGSDLMAIILLVRSLLFQSTLPCGSDNFQRLSMQITIRFQSTLPCGSDHVEQDHTNLLHRFQSTLPCGSDFIPANNGRTAINFNPRSLAGATDRSHVYKTTFNISIHAPLRERPRI